MKTELEARARGRKGSSRKQSREPSNEDPGGRGGRWSSWLLRDCPQQKG